MTYTEERLQRAAKAAVRKYGEKAQILMMIEEMGELSRALARHLSGRETNVEEEMADVMIIMEQLKVIFEFDEDKFINEKLNKLDLKLKRNKTHD